MWRGSAILHKQQGHLRLSHFIYFRTICLPYEGSVTWMPTRLSLQINKQTNKQTNMNARLFSEAKWQMARTLLFIYLQQQHIYHHYLSSSSRFTYVLKKWHYGNKWRNWEALTKIYFWQIGSYSNYTLKALKTIIEICTWIGLFIFFWSDFEKSSSTHFTFKSKSIN